MNWPALIIAATGAAFTGGHIGEVPIRDVYYCGNYRTDCGSSCNTASAVWTAAQVESSIDSNNCEGYWFGTWNMQPVGSAANSIVAENAIAYYQGESETSDKLPIISWRPETIRKFAPTFSGVQGDATNYLCLEDDEDGNGTPNACTDWDGVRGGLVGAGGTDSFDTAWILMTDQTTRTAVHDAYYAGADPCDVEAAHDWDTRGLERTSMCATEDGSNGPVLYGAAYTGTCSIGGEVCAHDDNCDGAETCVDGANATRITAVGLDIRIVAARTWNSNQLISMLAEAGITSGESVVVAYEFKPGWWINSGGVTNSAKACIASLNPAATAYEGHGTPDCLNESATSAAGPLYPSPYGAGEFENAANAQIRSDLSAAASNGITLYPFLVEAPDHLDIRGVWLDTRNRLDTTILGTRAATAYSIP